MRRREFIGYVGAAAAVPSGARAQQSQRVRTVAVLFAAGEQNEARVSAVANSLRDLGWIDGKNLRLLVYKPSSAAAEIRLQARELVAVAPDVILTGGSSHLGPVLEATRTVPVVFTSASDPVGAGYVASLKHPGGNVTGFMTFEYSLSGKWLELLKQIMPNVTRAAVIRDAEAPSGIGQFAVIQSVASSVGIDVTPVNARDAGEIRRELEPLARAQNVGLIVSTGVRVVAHADHIIKLAAENRLTAVYPRRFYVDRGGLCSYGPDVVALAMLGAGYVDRILRGEKPADLPVQAPTRYELSVNLKTARALAVALPPLVLARADNVIE